jgi:hypothetical protein
LYAVAASSLLQIRTHRRLLRSYVDEVLSGARTAVQLVMGALGVALAFSPYRFISDVPVSGIGKGVALEERVGELGSGPSGLRSGLSFLFLKIHLGCRLANTKNN